MQFPCTEGRGQRPRKAFSRLLGLYLLRLRQLGLCQLGLCQLGLRLPGLCLLGLAFLSACENRAAHSLADEAAQLLREGRSQQAAERFLAAAQLAQGSPLGHEALYWSSQVSHYFLDNGGEAERLYRRLLIEAADSPYAAPARASLAELYERTPERLHRALQLRHEMLQHAAPPAREALQRKIGLLNLRMRRWDEARHAFREVLRQPSSREVRAEVEYLVAYSYFLQRQTKIALGIMGQVAKGFPELPIGAHARFFIADTLEEQGRYRQALKTFEAARKTYPRKKLIDQRIKRLRLRLRRGVR